MEIMFDQEEGREGERYNHRSNLSGTEHKCNWLQSMEHAAHEPVRDFEWLKHLSTASLAGMRELLQRSLRQLK
jgi:hypothetical protein